MQFLQTVASLKNLTPRPNSLHYLCPATLDEEFRATRPAYIARRARYFTAEAEMFAGVLGAGAAAGERAVDDPDAALFDLILVTNALLPSGLSAPELGERAEVEALARRIAHLPIDGLRRRESLEALMPARWYPVS